VDNNGVKPCLDNQAFFLNPRLSSTPEQRRKRLTSKGYNILRLLVYFLEKLKSLKMLVPRGLQHFFVTLKENKKILPVFKSV
jgi:hypothetical protein